MGNLMTLDEALKILEEDFNDTIFTNTPEMVEAIEVVVRWVEEAKKDVARMDWCEKWSWGHRKLLDETMGKEG